MVVGSDVIMFKSTEDFEMAMREILLSLQSGDNELVSIYKKYGDIDTNKALSKCIDKNYIIDYWYDRAANGCVMLSIRENPRLSDRGLKFLGK